MSEPLDLCESIISLDSQHKAIFKTFKQRYFCEGRIVCNLDVAKREFFETTDGGESIIVNNFGVKFRIVLEYLLHHFKEMFKIILA